MTEDRLLEVLEEALSARVIEELPRTVGHYQFTQALIQETLLGELRATSRVRLHAQIATGLEALYGEDAEAYAGELAQHFTEAQTILGMAKVVKYSLLAGEQALSRYAHEEAVSHFRQGLAAKQGQPMDEETAGLLFGLTRGLSGRRDAEALEEAVRSLRTAFDYYVEIGDVSRAVSVTEVPLFNTNIEPLGLAEVYTRALSLVPPDSHEAGSILANYSYFLWLEKADFPSARQAALDAIAIAQRENDLALELRTVANAAVLETQDLRFNESLEWSQRAIELARETVNPFAEAQARLMASLASSYMGNLEGLREQLEAFLQMMENTQDRTGLSQALFCNEVASWMAGDWQLARGFNDRGLELTPAAPHQNLTRTVMEYELGNFEGGAASLDRYLELMGRRPPGPNIFYAGALLLTALASRISGDSHRLEEAEAAADVVLRSPIATPRYVSFARFGKGLLAVLRHDISSARVEYEALLPGKGRYDAWMSLDRLLGLLSQTLGNVDQAVTHFEDVLTFNRKEGLRPDLAWTCCDYADLLLERNNEGDRAKSTSLLDESLAISSELGMRALMERVLSRREILGA